MSIIRKFFYVCALALITASPLALSADHKDHEHDKSNVEGKYQFSGFSTNNSGSQQSAQQAQNSTTQTFVGQLKLKKHDNGIISFINFSSLDSGSSGSVRLENVPFTYVLGPKNGEGTFFFNNFPTPGNNTTLGVSFKSEHGVVTGFSAISLNQSGESGAVLLQGVRFD